MSFRGVFLAAVALCCAVVPAAYGMIDDYEQKWLDTLAQIETSPPPEGYKAQALSCLGIEFDTPDGTCTLPSRPEATSVHLLTPADIGIVAAIGDSITAGQGAKSSSIFDSPTKQAREISWSIGGEGSSSAQCTTIPNILKGFNPNVYGASTGSGDENSQGSNLNRAVSGAESWDIMPQAERLVAMIEALSPEDQNKWKLITLWIGGNDLCRYCSSSNKDSYSGTNFVNRIRETILYLKGKLTKTLVNVPQALDVSKITATNGLICGVVQWFACDCASESGAAEKAKEYQAALDDLENEDLDDDDFAVVSQPFFRNVDVPKDGNGKPDMSFFAPDCFHMSNKGHRAIAASLWNNMVKAKDDKEQTWEPYNPVLECPDPKAPYFHTKQTQSMLSGGGFNSQSLPDTEGSDDNNNKDWSIGQIFGYAIGMAASVYTLGVVVVLAVVAVVWLRKRRRANPDSEEVPLVKRR